MLTRQKKLFIAVAIAAAATVFSGTFYAGEVAVFSHKDHIENGASCPECHNSKPDKGELPVVVADYCQSCHDKPLPPSTVPGAKRALALEFKHKLHTDVAECVDCHQSTAQETHVAGEPVMGIERCFTCHKESGIEITAADCAKCHGKDQAKIAPVSHRTGWLQNHPKRAEEGTSKKHGQQCAQCHGQTPCLSCHQGRKAMSHKLHVEERGAEDCNYCHSPTAGALPTVKISACSDCHEGAVQTKNIGPRALPMSLKFPHNIHEATGQCMDCHKATIDGTQKKNRPVLTRQDCDSCHQAKSISLGEKQCARCHGEAVDRQKPVSHAKAWSFRHGKAAEWRFLEQHGEDCFLCHQKRECVTCHLTRRPKDHTGLWRVRMHGVAATFDRDRCRQCHETGTCISCHRRTKPLNHRGAWGVAHGLAAKVKSSEKCAVCHSRDWCVRCHSGVK